MTRRGFFATCMAALAWLGLGKTIAGCGGEIAFDVRVSFFDNGASVYQATSKFYQVLVEARSWNNPLLVGLRKVVAVGGLRSDSWIFEIDGQIFDGNADSAESTRVRTGQVITWRTV